MINTTKKLILGGIIAILLTGLLAHQAFAATGSINITGITLHGGGNVPAARFVQIIQSATAIPPRPNDNGTPGAGCSVVGTGLISPAGAFSSGFSITNGTYIFIRVWEVWSGAGGNPLPGAYYGDSAPRQYMSGYANNYNPAGFSTSLQLNPPDVTGPTMSFVPVTGAVNVATNQDVIITFNEAVTPGSLTYTMSPNPGGLSVAWSAGNTVATISHTAFAIGTPYTVTVSAVTDVAGNSYTGSHASSFTTAAAADVTGPTMSFVPVTGATDVVTNQNVIITFNEAVNTGSFTYTMNPDPGGRSVAWSAGNTVATISHTNFANSTSYTVTVTAVNDVAGNAYSGAHASSFTTAAAADATGPTMSFSPANGAVNIATNQNVEITFNEAMLATSLVYTMSPDPGGQNVTWNGNVATITHNAFANNTAYTVNVTAATDLAGNAYTGTHSTAFTTIPAAVTLSSIAVTPANPSITVGATRQFTATGTYSNGTTAEITATAAWTSRTPAVATINAAGLATAVASGESTIEATLSGVTGTTTLRVTAASTGESTAPIISGVAPSSAYVGQTIVVTGARFGTSEGTSTITIGGVRVRPTIWSNTSITAVVPRGVSNGANEVVITTGGGTGRGTITIVGAGTGLIIDDFEGGCVGNWNAPAAHSGYYVFASVSDITPSSANINRDLRVTDARRHGNLGARVTYSYNGSDGSDWGGGWGARLVDEKDLSVYETVTFYIRWDGSTNGFNLGLKDVDGTSVIAAVPNASLTALGSNYASITLNRRSAFALDAGGSDATSDGSFDWTRVINYNLIYNTRNTSSTPHYIDSIYAGDVTLGTGEVIIPPVVTPTGEVVITSVNPPAAPAGTRITVTGSGFGDTQGQSTVVFESTTSRSTYPVEIVSWTGTVIEAIVPRTAPAGAYTLRVVRLENAAGAVRILESNPSAFSVTANMSAAGIATIYPNPFNPLSILTTANQTTIAWNSGGATSIKIAIFDSTARLVYSQVLSGSQTTWNGRDTQGNVVADGVYMVRITNEESKSLIAKGRILVVKR